MRPAGRVAALAVAALAACSGDDGSGTLEPSSLPVNEALCLDVERSERPVVELIEPALAVVEHIYGAPQRFYEVSADRHRISLVVALDDGAAEQLFFCGAAGYTVPDPLGEASGATFEPEAIGLDPTSIFDRLDADLDDPEIVDLAITGGVDDTVIYDASVRSGAGGTLLVLLSGTGDVLAVQAR